MKVVVTGASGFLGQALCAALLAGAHSVVGVSRDPDKAGKQSDLEMSWLRFADVDFSDCDAVVHLAGERLLPGRWTAARKARIWSSRIEGTAALVDALRSVQSRPKVLLSASGIAFYGHRVDELVAESSPIGEGFLSEICREWEGEANKAQALGVRVVCMRNSVILGPKGGALKSMLPAFRMGAGGPMGKGDQPFPWMHLDDWVRFSLAALEREEIQGPVNLVAGAVPQKAFAKALGKALGRPSFLPAPGFALRMMMGEGADALLGGQNAHSERLEEWGLQPEFMNLDEALGDLL